MPTEENLDIHQSLLLAEKLLAYSHVAGCYQICCEVEALIWQSSSGAASNGVSHYTHWVQSLKRSLNDLLVKGIKQQGAQRNARRNAPRVPPSPKMTINMLSI